MLALETTYQELKGSPKKLGKTQRKELVEHTKLSESQVDQWVKAKNQARVEEMDSADFVPEPEALKAVSSRRGRGVVTSKVPSKRGGSKRPKVKEDVKLAMARNQHQHQVKTVDVKTAMSQLPKAVPSRSSPAQAQPIGVKVKAEGRGEGETGEVLSRVEELETIPRDKDSELEAEISAKKVESRECLS